MGHFVPGQNLWPTMYALTVARQWAIDFSENTIFAMIFKIFQICKDFPTSYLVTRTISRQILQHLLNGRIWTFCNQRFTRGIPTRAFVFFAILTQSMSLINTMVTIHFHANKSRDIFAIEALNCLNDVFKLLTFHVKWPIFTSNGQLSLAIFIV